MSSCALQEELYLQRVAQLDEITTERDKFKRGYEDLRKQRLNEFMTGFNMITNKLKENYQMLTLGGDAELELVDSLDPFSEGIMFRYDAFLFLFLLMKQSCPFVLIYFVSPLQRASSKEELEKDLQPVWRREDTQLLGSGVRTAPLQTHAAVLHGRDRCCTGLQERLHRCLLHLREYE